MRKALGSLLVVSLLASACQANLGVAGKTTPKPGTKPASTVPAGANLVPMPEGATIQMVGKVQMDASYVVAAGSANVVAAGSANVVAAGAGNLIKVGGQVIAAGSANVVAAGSANVVAAGAGNVIAAGSANYSVFNVSVPFGEMLPAMGMVIVPVSLRTGKPLGPAVLSDGTGAFQVHIPESETGNVQLVAAVPGKTMDDPILNNPKLQYEFLTNKSYKALSTTIDEDTALTSHYMLTAFAGRLEGLLQARNEEQWGGELGAWLGKTNNTMLLGLLKGMITEMLAAKTYDLTAEKRKALAYRLAKSVMYHVKLDEAMVDRSQPDFKLLEDQNAVDALQQIMKLCREGAIKTYGKDIGKFADNEFVKKANELRKKAGLPDYAFVKPTDIGDFVVQEYLTYNDEGRILMMKDVFVALGVDQGQVLRLKAAQYGLLTKVGQTMFLDAKAKEDFMTLIRASAQGGK